MDVDLEERPVSILKRADHTNNIEANSIANYLIHLAKPDSKVDPNWEEYDFTPLKLQKLLYYAQGFSLAKYGRPIFEEKILAWEHGPAVAEVYQTYKKYGRDPIHKDIDMDSIAVISKTPNTKEILEDVYKLYGQYSAAKLRQKTHEEPPWRNTRRNSEIAHGALIKYFSLIVR